MTSNTEVMLLIYTIGNMPVKVYNRAEAMPEPSDFATIMFRVLSTESGVWAVGLIPAAAGCAIFALAYFVRSAGVESRP